MRYVTVLVMILVWLLCLPAHAEEVLFNGGSLSITWGTDNQQVLIDLRSDTCAADDQSPVWILTVYGHRFIDGVFAWQIHYSAAMDSVLVLPNDFLTARNFTTAQLGIGVELSKNGSELSLLLPTLGAIPNLIAVGDLIEVHALWIQQAPLVSIALPAPTGLPVQHGINAAPDAKQVDSDLPAGGGAASNVPDHDIESSTLIPMQNRFVQGTHITHQFALQEATATLPRIVLSYTLMRQKVNGTREFARFSHVSYDLDTGIYSYAIDTTTLEPGNYSLRIDSSNSALAAQTALEIVAQEP